MSQAAAPTSKRNIWGRLIAPHPSITDIEMRRQSQLLAGLALALLLATVFAEVVLIGTASGQIPGTVKFVIFGQVVTLALYFLNRSGRYRSSAFLFVGLNFLMVHVSAVGSRDIVWLLFGSMMLLISAILMPVSVTFGLFVSSVVAQIVLSAVDPSQVSIGNGGALIVFLVTSSMAMVYMAHRSGLERARQEELREINKRLRESEADLERRVADRTRDLQIAADVSRQITTILDRNELLQAVVERTKAGFGLYHTSIFLHYPVLHSLVLEAGSGKAGEVMKAEGWHFDVSSGQGLVPEAARSLSAVVINDVSADGRYQPNPHLPQTRSEVALPMIVGDKLVGVLDLQSEEASRFSADDIRVMTTLAEQIAIAVTNAHLYAEQVQVAKRLREVDDMKSSFLASMSHELRTPLNAVLNFTKFVASGMLGPVNEKQVDALSKTVDSGRHLLSLINDVLDITKIESKMLNLFVETDVNLREELDTVLAAAETLLAGRPVTLIRDIDPDLPTLIGDRRRIRQIMLNLASNACKFTESGSITVGAHVQDQMVLLYVKDTGPGIAPEDHKLIFEAFRQTREGLSRGGGTGLGLAIAKRLAEAHGGRLWLESTPGQGSTFYVLLPIQSETLRAMITATAGA